MRISLVAGLGLCALSTAAHAQDAAPNSGSDAQALAKKLSNPVASLISVPFQENLDWAGGVGGDGFQSKLNIQPVIPISITKDANVIIRTILPVIYQDDLSAPGKSEFGLGDTVQSFFYSPKAPTKGGIIWGAGPAFLWPTATSKYTGGKKWGVGPTFVLLKQSGQSTFGLLANHIWSIAGDDDRSDISATFLNPFYSYTTKKATTFSLNTESTYDWKAEKWIVPINLNVSQLVRVGKQPISFGMGGRYYVSSPTGGPHWGLRFTTTFLFPKK